MLNRATMNPLSVAPMMDRTDRHFRYFLRQITRHPLLYTEMVTTPAIIHGERRKLLDFDPLEHPIALQLGGDDPTQLALCAKIGEDWGYDEINLNVGCPSDRVQSGNFGACLMAQPELVATCVAAMNQAVSIPVTVKHRIGIDDRDRYEDLKNFIQIVAGAGCKRFSVHARKAWLQGLSPKENRTVPPLRYGEVYQLKQDFPGLQIEINGGITTWGQIHHHLDHVDGVMVGRAIYEQPYLLAPADRELYGVQNPPPERAAIVAAMIPYIDRWIAQGGRLHSVTRHMLQLFTGVPGTKRWKRHISEHACAPGATSQVLQEALALVHH